MAWSLHVTRRLAAQIAQAWNFGWGEAMQRTYGVSVTRTLVYRDPKKTEYYADSDQHRRYVAGLYRLLANKKFLRSFHSQAQKILESILHQVQKRFVTDFSTWSKAELLALYRDFVLPSLEQFYIRMWTVFNLAEPLANVVRGELLRKVGSETRADEYLLALSCPLVPNDVMRERINLLKLAKQRKRLSKEQWRRKLERHCEAYQYIPMFDFDHEPYPLSHFIDELRRVTRPEQELKTLKREFTLHQQKRSQVIRALRPGPRLKLLLQFMAENVFLRDHRDMIREKLNLELKKFYLEAGKRMGLSVADVATLLDKEMIYYLGKGKKFPQAEVAKRQKAFVLIQKGKPARIYSGKAAVAKAKHELKLSHLKCGHEVRGVCGSPGQARGRVVVVLTNRDLPKVRPGDIMVIPMTRPDFVSVVRRAAAVVTDEGGVICHAAIIARELGIPCVVATKIGTKVFTEGELVLVDADKGVVAKVRH